MILEEPHPSCRGQHLTSVLEKRGPSFVSSRLIGTTSKIVNNPENELNSAVFPKEDYEKCWDNKALLGYLLSQ